MTDDERKAVEMKIEAVRRATIDHLRAVQANALAALDQTRKVIEYDVLCLEKVVLAKTAELQEQVIAISKSTETA